MPCQDSFALFNEDWAVYDSEVPWPSLHPAAPGCRQPRIGRDGRPPTLIRDGPRTERQGGKREGEMCYVDKFSLIVDVLPLVMTSNPSV